MKKNKIKLSAFAQELADSMEQSLAYMKGKGKARITTVTIPDPPPAFAAKRILTVRTKCGYSQAQFARLLNVSAKTVQGWEQGLRNPTGSALRLLQVIENPLCMKQVMPVHNDR